MESEIWIPRSTDLAIIPYPDPVYSSSHPDILVLKIRFIIILPFMSWCPRFASSVQFLWIKFCTISSSFQFLLHIPSISSSWYPPNFILCFIFSFSVSTLQLRSSKIVFSINFLSVRDKTHTHNIHTSYLIIKIKLIPWTLLTLYSQLFRSDFESKYEHTL